MEKAFKTQCPTLGDSPYLLFLSRIHVKKGVDLLVKVYLKLKSQGFTLPKLVISGPGLDTPYGQQMMELASNEKDILFPGIGEIVGGSQREERLEKLQNRMREMHIPEEELYWYLDTRRFGACEHAGFGLGFERLVLFVTGMSNIRDVIAFPRYPGNAEF